MARKKEGIAKLRLMITEDPDGASYVQLTSEELTQQFTVRELIVVDLRRTKASKPGEGGK